MLILASYVGDGKLYNKAVRWWTSSDVSHSELVFGPLQHSNMAVTASARDGGVKMREIVWDPTHWRFTELPWLDHHTVYKTAAKYIGCKYDWYGLFLSQVLARGLNSGKRFFCSEFVGHLIGFPNPHRLSPADLEAWVQYSNALKGFSCR